MGQIKRHSNSLSVQVVYRIETDRMERGKVGNRQEGACTGCGIIITATRAQLVLSYNRAICLEMRLIEPSLILLGNTAHFSSNNSIRGKYVMLTSNVLIFVCHKFVKLELIENDFGIDIFRICNGHTVTYVIPHNRHI